jgi:predicted  nucleic acid-binding Zn-ribbon protein
MSSITKIPQCIYCGQVFETWTGSQCLCDGAKEMRAIRKEAEDAKRAKQAEANQRLIPIAPVVVDDGWARLRREFAKDQAAAVRETTRDAAWEDVKDRRLALAQQELDGRERPPSQPAEGLTLADFRQEVTLLGVERLPSALTRSDGATLLYEGRFNTVYGETAMGKTWIAIMTVIERLRAGQRVVWWDSEDRVSTLALRLQLLRATDLIGTPELAWVSGDIHDSPAALGEALAHLDGGAIPGLVAIDSATSFGCPSDGADVAAWLNAYINPWWNAGHTVLLVDHVPKQKKDRPRGGIGSQAKLARVDGAALYAHGVPWNGQEGGYIHLTVQG